MEKELLEIGDKLRCNNSLEYHNLNFKENEMYEIIDILHYKIFKSCDIIFKGYDKKHNNYLLVIFRSILMLNLSNE